MTPISKSCKKGALHTFAFEACGEKYPQNCHNFEKLFQDVHGHDASCGVFNGIYCFDFRKGSILVSGSPEILYAFCAKNHNSPNIQNISI